MGKKRSGAAKALHITGIALKAIVTAIAALLLVYNVYVFVARLAFGVGIPTVFGFGFATVETGSMSPEIEAGDFIVIRASDSYEMNDVITFYDSSRSQYVTHRIIRVGESGYTTKGDANNTQDAFTVTDDVIVGKVVLVAGGLGAFIGFLQSPVGLLTAVGVCVLVWVAATYVPKLFDKSGDDEDDKEGKDGSGPKDNG